MALVYSIIALGWSHALMRVDRARLGAVRMGASSGATAELKRAVLATIAEVRRERTPKARAAFLAALAALEAVPSDRLAIDGRWSLVYSTDIGAGADAAPRDPLQQVFGEAYKVFFRFAPALAGGQDVAFLGASNEQIVDLAAGVVDNTVTLRPPVGKPLVLCVRGLVERDGDEPASFAITFTESELRGAPLGPLRVPLPRPRGRITSTFSDGDMRVVRGSRGTLFVLQRARADR